MCVLCKKPWEAQHEGLTCEQFAQWKIDNDPDALKAGLAAHLMANGIECPQCGMKYDLARGGSMHFKCTICPNEFCSGCGESFKNGQQCGKLESCAKRGLHGHHPRDCLFYMRDFDVEELQEFLRENNIKFDTEPPKEQVEAARRMKREMEAGVQEQPEDMLVIYQDQAADVEPAAEPQDQQQAAAAAAGDEEEEVELHCRVEEQKEFVDGLKDEACGRKVEKGHAGLCLIHYKEYLVKKVNKEKLDPVELYTTIKITAMLTKEELALPDKNDFDDDDQYREGLIEEVKDKLPLTFEDNKRMCVMYKILWEEQHEGARLTCEQFAQWKGYNDPQEAGLAAHLKANGIGDKVSQNQLSQEKRERESLSLMNVQLNQLQSNNRTLQQEKAELNEEKAKIQQENRKLKQQLTRQKTESQQQIEQEKSERKLLQQQLSSMIKQLQSENTRLQQEITRLKEQLTTVIKQKTESQQQIEQEREVAAEEKQRMINSHSQAEQQLHSQLRQKEVRLQELQKQLDSERAESGKVGYTQLQVPSQDQDSWNVPRGDVEIIGEIGRGGWGLVLKGRFKGQTVAVKQAFREILGQPYTIRLMKREIQIMASVQHPNLVRFIAAVIDDKVDRGEDTPLLVVEMLDMDLRHAYKTTDLGMNRIPIFRDVAYGLHYLHEHQEPIIHRDVSAPNVLLQHLQGGTYRAKLSDFGSANKAKDARTAGPGAICYTAPEAFPPVDIQAPVPPQTPKVDVYSYGILLAEVITRTMPTTENRRQLLCEVGKKWMLMYDLICLCTKPTPSNRPTMASILNTLNRIPTPRPRQVSN